MNRQEQYNLLCLCSSNVDEISECTHFDYIYLDYASSVRSLLNIESFFFSSSALEPVIIKKKKKKCTLGIKFREKTF